MNCDNDYLIPHTFTRHKLHLHALKLCYQFTLVEKSREDASRILNKKPHAFGVGFNNPGQHSGTVRKPLDLIPNCSPSFNFGFA